MPRLNVAFWIGIVVLIYFLFASGKAFWVCYWLTRDAKQSTAVLTREHEHGVVSYRYTVNQHEYSGSSQRNGDERYRNIQVGQESIVFFSVSHPWISSLETPFFPPKATPFFILALLFLTSWVVICQGAGREMVPERRAGGLVQARAQEGSHGSSVALSTSTVCELRWYHELWVALPFILLIWGGALGGVCGGAAWSINRSLFRRIEQPVSRYLWTGLVSAAGVGIFLAFILMARRHSG